MLKTYYLRVMRVVASYDHFFTAELLLIGLTLSGFYSLLLLSGIEFKPSLSLTQEAVLGESTPAVRVRGSNNDYGVSGVISLASTDDPALKIFAYNATSNMRLSLYQAGKAELLSFLLYDQEDKQVNPKLNIQTMKLVYETDFDVPQDYEDTYVNLPLGESGIWYFVIKNGDVEEHGIVIRAKHGLVAKEGRDTMLFWGQDFKTKRSVNGGKVELYNLKNSVQVIDTVVLGEQGLGTAPMVSNADIAISDRDGDLALVPLNLQYLNYGYAYARYMEREANTWFFVFTDRPLYRPGDTVYYKAVLRRDVDTSYSIPSGEVTVGMYSGWGDESLVEEKELTLDEFGSTFGQFTVPEGETTGEYHIEVRVDEKRSTTVYFGVEHFRKPEYFITVDVNKDEMIAGESGRLTVRGEYFSGQPITNDTVKYEIYSSNFYDYQYYSQRESGLNDDYRYGYSGNTTIATGDATFGSDGLAVIDYRAVIPEGEKKSQVYSIEVTYDNGSGNPVFARKNVLVLSGEYDIYLNDDSLYLGKVDEKFVMPFLVVGNLREVDVQGVELNAKITRHYWVEEQVEGQKYANWVEKTEALSPTSGNTDKEGKLTLAFTPSQVGSYEVNTEMIDTKGNVIRKDFNFYISDQGYYSRGNDFGLSVVLDKTLYQPTDTAKISIASKTPDRDVLFSFDREYMHRYQIVHLDGNQKDIEVQLEVNDIPNIYASAQSFSGNYLDSVFEQLTVSPASQELKIEISSDKLLYGPGESVNLSVTTTDYLGNPVASDLALWAVDKAIFELTGKVSYDIFEHFWRERYYSTVSSHSLQGITALSAEQGGGCFASDTDVLMADGTDRAIAEVQIGDKVLTRTSEAVGELVAAAVTGVHKIEVPGYLIINADLRVTPEHMMWVNGIWKEAGSIQHGDLLTDMHGESIEVSSVEWQIGPFVVYNLEIADRHTYFAGGVWVHNQKGETRDTFADTAYWNPRVRTGIDGKGEVTFKLPDNLTTWVIAGVGSTVETKVGSSTHEIVVSKEVVVRPNMPNLLRVGDKATLTALVQNFTDKERDFNVKMEWDGGQVNTAEQTGIKIGAHQSKLVSWEVVPQKEIESELKVSAWDSQDETVSDIVMYTLPVVEFGFVKKDVQVGRGGMSFDVVKKAQVNPEKSTLTLSLSPTILGSLPEAMKYLVQYPYGCVEQTTSRLVPLLMVKQHPELFADVVKSNDIDEMVEKGLQRLKTQQAQDGSWSWWSGAEKNAYVSAYVVEILKWAQELGYQVDPAMWNMALSYFQREDEGTNEEWVYQMYVLSLVGEANREQTLIQIAGMKNDIAAMAVIANVRNGHLDPTTNGLNELEHQVKHEGEMAYWTGGDDKRFGSSDASTAMVIKAMMIADGDDELIADGVAFLMRNRRQSYWSNTFGTAKVLQALTDYAKTSSELSPNYTYHVQLDGVEIAKGSINDVKQIQEVAVDYHSTRDDGSTVTVSMQGDGEMYSTLVLDEFVTEEIKEDQHGLRIVRDYWSEDGRDLSQVKVGDTIYVKLSIVGADNAMDYGVIEDQLPAGITPINTSFANERSGKNNPFGFMQTYGETTLSGKVLSLYAVNPGVKTYTYKARVAAPGEYRIPPAYVGMMYSPEIYAYSDTQYMTINAEGIKFDHPVEIDHSVTDVALDSGTTGLTPMMIILIGAGGGLLLGGGGYWIYKARQVKKQSVVAEDPNEIVETKEDQDTSKQS